jgi:hypothetical protein
MKLKSISILLIVLLTSASALNATQVDTLRTQMQQLQQQVDLLKDYKANQADAFRNKAADLDLQVEAIKTTEKAQLTSIVISGIAIILGIFGGWVGIYQKLKAQAEKMISRKLQSLVKDKADELAMLLNREARLVAFRTKKRILVLCHDATREAEMAILLNEKFQFDNVKTVIATKYSSPQNADIIVIDHENYKEETEFQHLPMSLVLDYVHGPDPTLILYFGPINQALRAYSSKISFANNQVTLFNRMVEVFDYQEGMKQNNLQ